MVEIRQAKHPVTFTQAAITHLLSQLASENASVFRLSVKDSGCNGWKYHIELLKTPVEQDVQYEVDGLSVAIKPDAIKYLSGTTLDFTTYENSLGMKKLIFNNPNISGECGCGESFNIEEPGDDE